MTLLLFCAPLLRKHNLDYHTEAPAVCNVNPGHRLSVCSAAQLVDSLKTKQSSKYRINLC